jgi:farnesyl-diphosphate farnesyltransferase
LVQSDAGRRDAPPSSTRVPAAVIADTIANSRLAPDTAAPASDAVFQARMLDGVSRTFALTIPQLPADLHPVVANAYLLCRIIDTIEDETALSVATKREFSARFVRAVLGEEPAEHFAAALFPLLSDTTLAAERELIRETPRVLAITHGFNPAQRDALATCVRVMGEGMVRFQENRNARGLDDLAAMDRYCYHVAGVVGEMLTRLFCEHSPAIAQHRDRLMPLSVSFGQGLQMTNILKDIWADLERGACWLPRTVFGQAGFDLKDLAPNQYNAAFGRGLTTLVAIAHGHLRTAVRYTLLIPSDETGIRNFCLWAIGMAVLTLRKIHRHPDFAGGDEVKISRRSVRAIVIASRLAAGHDRAIRMLFAAASAGIPMLQTEMN